MDAQAIAKFKPRGPWVLVKPEEPKRVSDGGIYFPEGNLLERLGHAAAVVVAVSSGYYEKKPGKSKEVFVPMDIKPGDRVLYRGHLQDANPMGEGHSLVHIKDLVGVLEAGVDVDPSMPHG